MKILNESKLQNIAISDNESSKFLLNTNIIIDNIAALDFIISPNLNQKEMKQKLRDHWLYWMDLD